MTAPNGAIKFNNLTGSDTQSSGLGPAVAVYGSGASTTGASNVVTGINTAGVSSGDLLWVQSSSGRQFSIITTVDSGSQVTCDDNFDNTESGRTWAIGGKRATLDNSDSRRVLADDVPASTTGVPFWSVEIQETGTPYYCTSTLDIGTGGGSAIKLYGDTGNVEISFNSNTTGISGRKNFKLQNLKLSNTNATKTASYAVYRTLNSVSMILENVVLDQTNNWYRGVSGNIASGDLQAINCDISHCVDYGIRTNAAQKLLNCRVRNNGGSGVLERARGHYISCIFSGNSGYGVQWDGNPGYGSAFANCIVKDNTSGGLYVRSTYSGINTSIVGCIFDSNGGYAIDLSSADSELHHSIVENNAFYNSTTSNYRTYDRGGITLTADPFVDAANGDFNINNAAGGGAVLRSTKYTLGG